MVTTIISTLSIGKLITLVDLYTANKLGFRNGTGPQKMSIPVPAGSNGLTVMFYLKSNPGITGGGYAGLLSAAGLGMAGSTMYNNTVQPAWTAYAGGVAGSVASNVNSPGVWVRWVLVSTPDAMSRVAGNLYINGDEGFGSGAVDCVWADLRLYDRALSPAEIAATFPPSDMMAYYTFANLVGNSVPDETGQLPAATIYF